MKYVRILCAVALFFALCSAFTMKDKEKAVYAFGVAASFNDSIVYYTKLRHKVYERISLSYEI